MLNSPAFGAAAGAVCQELGPRLFSPKTTSRAGEGVADLDTYVSENGDQTLVLMDPERVGILSRIRLGAIASNVAFAVLGGAAIGYRPMARNEGLAEVVALKGELGEDAEEADWIPTGISCPIRKAKTCQTSK